MTECEKLGFWRGRLRDLCEGKGSEGRPDPPWSDVVEFRKMNCLSPLPPSPEIDEVTNREMWESAWLPKEQQEEREGPGTKLQEIFAQLGIPYREKGNCHAFARQMNHPCHMTGVRISRSGWLSSKGFWLV